MHITRLQLRDFRSYTEWELEPDPALTVLLGPNAVGKTNAIEAIQVVATGSSFRNPDWKDLVRWGAGQASVRMLTEGELSRADVELTIKADGTKSWRVDGASKRRIADAARFVPAVAFTPDDLTLVKGPAEQRRNAIDALGEQLSATYGALRRDYGRVVRQRNALLRDEAPDSDIEPWDTQLVSLGARLYVHRRRLLARVAAAASPIYEHLSAGESFDLRLVDKANLAEGVAAGGDQKQVEDALHREIERRQADERARKTSLVGPHRDDIVFYVRDHDARTYASQGQQRTVALAWKWAEVTILTELLHKTPVLLLDDVMSELDASRRAALTELVQRDVQTFVTTTTTEYFDSRLLKAARVVALGG